MRKQHYLNIDGRSKLFDFYFHQRTMSKLKVYTVLCMSLGLLLAVVRLSILTYYFNQFSSKPRTSHFNGVIPSINMSKDPEVSINSMCDLTFDVPEASHIIQKFNIQPDFRGKLQL